MQPNVNWHFQSTLSSKSSKWFSKKTPTYLIITTTDRNGYGYMAPTYATLVMGVLEKKIMTNMKTNMAKQRENNLRENSNDFQMTVSYSGRKQRRNQMNCSQYYTASNSQWKPTRTKFHSQTFWSARKIRQFSLTFLTRKLTAINSKTPFRVTQQHAKQDIPYTLARRICNIVKKDHIREKRLDELKIFLRKQHYPKEIINRGIQKAEAKTISSLISCLSD